MPELPKTFTVFFPLPSETLSNSLNLFTASGRKKKNLFCENDEETHAIAGVSFFFTATHT